MKCWKKHLYTGALAIAAGLLLFAVPAFASTKGSMYTGGPRNEGPGGSAVLREAPAGEPEPSGSSGALEIDSSVRDRIYHFEGKNYQIDRLWGDHKLTGFNPTPKYGRLTYSGKDARAKHTCATSSELPIGTVIIVEGFSGPECSRYDGVYVVEDRGGPAVETGVAGTGYVSVVDIFFDTEAEANEVTDAGWKTAHIWIAKEVS